MHERQELPGVQPLARGLKLGVQRICECQIQIVPAQQNWLAAADTLKVQAAFDICDRDQAEIGGPATDIADQHNIAICNQVSPFSARLRHPGVECSLRLLQQYDVRKPRSPGGPSGETS